MAVLRKSGKGPAGDTIAEAMEAAREKVDGFEFAKKPLSSPTLEERQDVIRPSGKGASPLANIKRRFLSIPLLKKPSIEEKSVPVRDLRRQKPQEQLPPETAVGNTPSFPHAEPESPNRDEIFPEEHNASMKGRKRESVHGLSQESASNRPMDHEKVGYISPTYDKSRSVNLNPQVMLTNRCVGFQHNSPELEFYRVLRTQILQRSRDGGNTVMVTSALPGEGKTLTAINLAFTFAKEFNQTALLVDCDLKRQQVHKTLGFASGKGLADYLLDDCPLSELFVWPGVEKLSIISGGKTVADSSELLGSPGMKNLVSEMKNRYPERYIFFDVPPLLTSADPMAFAPLVDYIVVAVEAGRTSMPDLNTALGFLPSEKVLGLVMNRQKQQLKPYAQARDV